MTDEPKVIKGRGSEIKAAVDEGGGDTSSTVVPLAMIWDGLITIDWPLIVVVMGGEP